MIITPGCDKRPESGYPLNAAPKKSTGVPSTADRSEERWLTGTIQPRCRAQHKCQLWQMKPIPAGFTFHGFAPEKSRDAQTTASTKCSSPNAKQTARHLVLQQLRDNQTDEHQGDVGPAALRAPQTVALVFWPLSTHFRLRRRGPHADAAANRSYHGRGSTRAGVHWTCTSRPVGGLRTHCCRWWACEPAGAHLRDPPRRACWHWPDGWKSQGVQHVGRWSTGVTGSRCAHPGGPLEAGAATPAHVKNRAWRKTDVNDAVWLADLLAHGLIRASFVPPTAVQELRTLTRTRKQFVRERASARAAYREVLRDGQPESCPVVLQRILGLAVGVAVLKAINRRADPARAAGGLRHHAGQGQPQRVARGTARSHQGAPPLHAQAAPGPHRRAGPGHW
ncbi:hypothetical protein FQR65_LT20486 [Abscondita terminalis]|nr:hypothetical protein FQR65_LT20486 [Abscondita terminalis]